MKTVEFTRAPSRTKAVFVVAGLLVLVGCGSAKSLQDANPIASTDPTCVCDTDALRRGGGGGGGVDDPNDVDDTVDPNDVGGKDPNRTRGQRGNRGPNDPNRVPGPPDPNTTDPNTTDGQGNGCSCPTDI